MIIDKIKHSESEITNLSMELAKPDTKQLSTFTTIPNYVMFQLRRYLDKNWKPF